MRFGAGRFRAGRPGKNAAPPPGAGATAPNGYSAASDTRQATRVRPRRSPTGEGPRRLHAGAVTAPAPTGSPFTQTSGRDRMLWLAVDAVALLGLLGLLLVALLPAYGWGWVAVTVLGGGLLGMVVGWLGWRLRLNSALVGAALIGCWFVFGTLLAMPSSGLGRVVPTARSLRGLLTGPVTAPKDMLTIEPPIGETWNLLTVPLLLAMLSTVVAVSLSLRSRHPVTAWLPGVLALVAAWALGTSTTYQALPVALGTVALVLLWTSSRRRMLRETLVAQRRTFNPVNALIGLTVLLLAGGVAWGASPLLRPTQARAVARHAVAPPLQVNNYGSPLQGMRGVLTNHENDVMLTVTGAPEGSKIRIATMDVYDGSTFSVSNSSDQEEQNGQFRRIGSRIIDPTRGEQAEVTINLAKYQGVWIPTVGQSTRIVPRGPRAVAITDTVFYNKASGTALTTAGMQSGDEMALSAIVPARPEQKSIESAEAGIVAQPAPQSVPDSVKELALRWTATAGTKGEAALMLEKQLKNGYFSHGLPKQAPSLSGHSNARLTALLEKPEQMVGDEEQYASTMALMARQLGIPSRVVYGYRTPESGSGDVRGRDVGAWTELNLQGLGWVMFDPTPPQNRVPTQQDQDPPPKPRPHVDNPPPIPKKPQAPPPDNDLNVDQAPPPPDGLNIDWKKLGTWAAVIGIPLIVLVGPIVLILGLKGRRRRTRRHDPIIPNRVAGAWSELIDKARDLGRSPAPTATRSEQAETMATQFPKLIEQADPIALAKKADAVVFSPETINEEQAENYWGTMAEAERGVRKSVSLPAWVRSRLSTKSFRRYKG